MKSRWTIRKKLLMAMVVLGIVVAVLGYSSFRGVYAYRDLATTLSSRASEMPLTSELTRRIHELRIGFRRLDIRSPGDFLLTEDFSGNDRHRFREQIHRVREVLARYKSRLDRPDSDGPFLSDRREEQEKAAEISDLLTTILQRHDDMLEEGVRETLEQIHDLERLSDIAYSLPMLLTERMTSFKTEVRSHYRTWIMMTWSSAILAGALLIGLISYARMAVIKPFKELLAGARRVASGDFAFRIHVDSKDELAELANAINLGATSFLDIQRDLNEQVRERSREVIRNEQLASVGFLAAGVAHEINNPLASIAWSAEALESRLHRILHATTLDTVVAANPASTDGSTTAAHETIQGTDLETLRNYLRRIQDEAFRCKGITERLLDFSRLGNAQRKQSIDMNEITEDVVDMVRHLGQYRSQKIEFHPKPMPMIAWASPQEMKQVILNLLTNSLESLDPTQADGLVSIAIESQTDSVRIVIEDNGCGMSDEVLQHLFEPFFTRRRDGRGTGLGLPITSRIIADHGGHITPYSLGENLGSRFEILLPNRPINDSMYEKRSEYDARADQPIAA